MLRRSRFLCALLLGLLLHAAPAYGAPGDPEAGSPSGGVYEVPLDAAREDAAPGSGGTAAPTSGAPGRGSGGGGSSGEGSGGGTDEETESSSYRSENNFGSSSQVPGTAGRDAGTDEDGAAAGAGATGSGATADVGGAAGGAEASSTTAQDTGNTSVAGNLALLAAIGLLAAGLGVVLNRRRVKTR